MKVQPGLAPISWNLGHLRSMCQLGRPLRKGCVCSVCAPGGRFAWRFEGHGILRPTEKNIVLAGKRGKEGRGALRRGNRMHKGLKQEGKEQVQETTVKFTFRWTLRF